MESLRSPHSRALAVRDANGTLYDIYNITAY
jgi:hypothetical protein